MFGDDLFLAFGVILTALCIVTMIFLFGIYFTSSSIINDCQTFGAFKLKDVVYLCSVKEL